MVLIFCITRTQNVPSNILPKFDCYDNLALWGFKMNPWPRTFTWLISWELSVSSCWSLTRSTTWHHLLHLSEPVLRSYFSFLLITSWKHETCLPEMSTMMHHIWIYWCTERGSYPFTQYPTKIFNRAIIRSPLMNTLMSFSLHCSRAGIFKRYNYQ